MKKVVCHLSSSPYLGKVALAREADLSQPREANLLNYGDVIFLQFDDTSLPFAHGWWPFPRSAVTFYPERAPLIRPIGYAVEYSYAGFEYRLTKTEVSPGQVEFGVRAGQVAWSAMPLPKQHPSAFRLKHRSDAVMSYLTEYNEQ